jgi:hypothetical protein
MRIVRTLGDRMLSALLPKSKAQAFCCPGAGYCYYTHCGACQCKVCLQCDCSYKLVGCY